MKKKCARPAQGTPTGIGRAGIKRAPFPTQGSGTQLCRQRNYTDIYFTRAFLNLTIGVPPPSYFNMKAHFLLVLVSLALAAAKDILPFQEQASEDHQPPLNVIERSLANKPQNENYGDGLDFDYKGGPHNEDEGGADVEPEDHPTEPAQTRGPSSEDTTAAPPTSSATADAQVEDSVEDASDPAASKPTQKDYCYQRPPKSEDESTTTMTSTTTLTHFVTVPRPSSPGPSPEPSTASSGAANAEEPVALAERPPRARNINPIRIDPLDTGAADSSIPHPTSPDGQYEEVPFKSAPSLLPWWVTDGASGFPPAGPGNRTIPSAAAPRKTTVDEDAEPWAGGSDQNKTPWDTDTDDAVQPPVESQPPEGPATEPLDPPASSPTTGPEASQTGQTERTSGTWRWMPDVIFAGAVLFVSMALLGEL